MGVIARWGYAEVGDPLFGLGHLLQEVEHHIAERAHFAKLGLSSFLGNSSNSERVILYGLQEMRRYAGEYSPNHSHVIISNSFKRG